MAKRIALYSISISAGKYKKVIKPLISFNADFYIRLFLIVKDSPEECKLNAFKYGHLYHCRSCQNRYITPLAHTEEKKKKDKTINKFKFSNNVPKDSTCEVCDGNMCFSGPYWIGDLHDEEFLDNVIANIDSEKFQYLKYNKRIKMFLGAIKEELPLKSEIFSYDYAKFSADLTLCAPKLPLIRYYNTLI